MRMASRLGRAVLVHRDGARYIDIAEASTARFGPTPLSIFDDWDDFRAWADGYAADWEQRGQALELTDLDAPSPSPRQTFAIGLNYRSHADEAGHSHPQQPPTFTKFVSSFSGPVTELVLPSASVDWEVELVVIIGRAARAVSVDQAWSHVAGLTVGQDFSERDVQLAGPAPQFSLGKSFAGFGPQGPWLVTPDEFEDPADLELACSVNGVEVQSGRTKELIFSVAELIARLSGIANLLPGDVIFTGTPAGVGGARTPKWFLKPGDVVVSTIRGIGSLTQSCISA